MDIRQARREYKFRLSTSQVTSVMDDILAMLPKDANGTGGAYPIVSEYYDTAERDAYWERYRKVPNRRKLRVRIYGTSNGLIPPSAFLEVKHKQDGVGVKRRIAVPYERVCREDFDVAALVRELQRNFKKRSENALAKEILRLVEVRGVRPVVQMRYDRVAFEGPDNVRVTFDGGIMCRGKRLALQPDDSRFENLVLPEGERILEVKLFGSAPYWLREMMARHRLTKAPFSKYCEALAGFDHRINGLLTSRVA